MKFRRRHPDEPEINLIPFIDVLLVVLIFLMLSTTYAQHTVLKVNLPQTGDAPPTQLPLEVVVAVSSDGRYAVGGAPLPSSDAETLRRALSEAARGRQEVQVVVAADALVAHQRVMTVLDAARAVGLTRIAFAAQQQQAAP
ncbi:ExbD/TolR family protein [Pseudorhodoferax sp.]|jgi:biopolymer transport protein ExbD|uniref:ExbD/TolR family protein n=1 Tax=Pseudorhodoferax sp. TaxID=1993553 RepID=UPI001B6C37EC|nr:biopolymer transporter ExbD [Pseudorhodoferax sp.]MBP8143815.1 biopolymer transporter ExbD [Inhella sp.]